MRLSIITINFNSSECAIRLLRSIQKQTDRGFSLTVVDNVSEESDFRTLSDFVISANLDNVSLVRNKYNLGFGGGNNKEIRTAISGNLSNRGQGPLQEASGRADWVFLLNIDTWVEPDFIASLKARLDGLEGIVSVPLVEGDKTAYCGKVEWLKPTLKHIYHPPYTEYLRRNTNYYAIGGGLVIHKDVFAKAGFLDDKYFIYFEDADFSLRVQRAGFKLNFIDNPKIFHNTSSVNKKIGSPLLLRYHYRNSLYFNLKNGPWHIKFLVWLWSFWVATKQLLKIMLMYKQNESLAILLGVFDFYFNKMGKIK